MRIADDTVMSGTLLSVSSEKLLFPGQSDSAGTAMLKNDARNTSGGFIARPIALPFAQYGNPVDWYHAGLNHAAMVVAQKRSLYSIRRCGRRHFAKA
jgi:hypothetical protein